MWCPPSLNFDSMMKQACGMVVELKVVNSTEAPMLGGGGLRLAKNIVKTHAFSFYSILYNTKMF